MGPLRGDGNDSRQYPCHAFSYGREDGSPSWGRKRVASMCFINMPPVEKMGPLRGDGNRATMAVTKGSSLVEKMGPLRGDGNCALHSKAMKGMESREDGSPSWGRKHIFLFHKLLFQL